MQMIIRKGLIELIYKDLQEKKIIYLSAPCGWGKTVLLHQIADFLRSRREECVFLHTQEEVGQGLVSATHPKGETEKEAQIFLVDNLEEWLMSGRMEALMNHIHIGRKENKFILGEASGMKTEYESLIKSKGELDEKYGRPWRWLCP